MKSRLDSFPLFAGSGFSWEIAFRSARYAFLIRHIWRSAMTRRLNEQVYVGGLQFPDSRLIIGKNCSDHADDFHQPTKSITIGDDTGIGGDSLLFGHTSWLSRFEGYPVDFRPIEIGNSVSIAWRVLWAREPKSETERSSAPTHS